MKGINLISNLSTGEFSKYILEKNFQCMAEIMISNADSILDIGCGIGDYLKYTNPKQKVTAIEPHAPYIEKAKEIAPWADIKNTDGLSFLRSTEKKFDLILLIDVVEHLEEDDGFQLISEAIKHCNGIVFSQIPIGNHEQSEDVWNLGGDYWQTHRTTWDEEKLSRTEFNFTRIWKDWYDWPEESGKSCDLSIAMYFKNPVVSVVIPTYNQAEWLPKTLNSVAKQTYPFWEVIVVDDGSTDNTWEIIEEYMRTDKRIRGYQKENGGISSALNKGIEHASGKYFCWLSSDDIFKPDKLALQVNKFAELDETYGIIFGDFDLIDDKDNLQTLNNVKPFHDGLEFPQQLKYDMVDGCTVMIPMTVMREMGGFNTQFKHAQDTEFWFRLAAKGYKFAYLDSKLTMRRIHPEQGFTDFRIDCRYDGYWIVHYYLTHYSFREFYRNVDFENGDDLRVFMQHFFDMITDPDCHVNHPLVSREFWAWFENGLRTLSFETRDIICENGIKIFNDKSYLGDFYRKYAKRLENTLAKVKAQKKEDYFLSDVFHDITKSDRAKDTEYTKRMFDFGEFSVNNGDFLTSEGVNKYLCDFPNTLNQKAFKKFLQQVLVHGSYNTFIKSFKRKQPIETFPDEVKAVYVFSQIMENYKRAEIDKIVATIDDSKTREKVDKWLDNSTYQSVPLNNIEFWNFNVVPYHVNHWLSYRCDSCEASVQKLIKLPLSGQPENEKTICPNCLEPHLLTDKKLYDYFYNRRIRKRSSGRSGPVPRIAFVMRYTEIMGGGIKVAYRHIQWLFELGCEIVIYSDAPEPTWIDLPGKFIQLSDHYDIEDTDFDLVVAISVYDIPKLLLKFHPDKIAHLCQGYEGYHIGRDFEHLRADKYFYTQLHSLPVKNILVSKHLMEMFESKFGRSGNYIPNGVNLSVFRPMSSIPKEQNSILFVGYPQDPLKGIKFLIDAIAQMQFSTRKVENLKVYIVFGGSSTHEQDELHILKSVEVIYKHGLTSEAMSELMNRVQITVSTSWYEGFGLPVLETMACGTPVITTANMGSESFCVDGVNSFIIDYGDVKALQSRISEILNGKIEIENLCQAGLETAYEYSNFNSAAKFVHEYSKLIGKELKQQYVENFLTKFPEPNLAGAKEELLAKFEVAKIHNRIYSLDMDMLNSVQQLYSSNKLQEALLLLDNFLTTWDENKTNLAQNEVLNLAGEIAAMLSEYELSNTYYERELELNPESGTACAGLAENLYSMGNLEGAKTMLEWAIKYDSGNLKLSKKMIKIENEIKSNVIKEN